jgi:hypothetical protein
MRGHRRYQHRKRLHERILLPVPRAFVRYSLAALQQQRLFVSS